MLSFSPLTLSLFNLLFVDYSAHTDYTNIIIGSILMLICVTFFSLKWYLRPPNSNSLINKKSIKLQKEIRVFEKKINKLDERYQAVSDKMNMAPEMDKKVVDVIESNLGLWKNQLDIYAKVIHLYQKRINKLSQHKEEIKILNYVISKIKEDPGMGGNPNKELKRLSDLTKEVDQKINISITNDINSLILKLDDKNRLNTLQKLKKKIDLLEQSI